MIRDANKVYGEVNDPNTVIFVNSAAVTPGNYYVTGYGNKGLAHYSLPANTILITDNQGKLSGLTYTGHQNKVIGTNGSGEIVLLDRSVLI